MKRSKILLMIMIISVTLTFSIALSSVPTNAGDTENVYLPYDEFNPGNTDLNILNGGTMVQDGHVTYYSEDGTIYRENGDDSTVIISANAKNLNLLGEVLYYTVSNGESTTLKTVDVNTLAESEVLNIASDVNQMYLVNSSSICYLAGGSIYVYNVDTGEETKVETGRDVFSFMPTEYGIIYAVGTLFDLDIYAGSNLVAECASNYYSDQGYVILRGSDLQDYQINIQRAFNGTASMEELSIYSTASLSSLLCEDEDCEVCQANYEAFLNGEISLSDYEPDEDTYAATGSVQLMSTGQDNIVLRAKQMTNVSWTPLKTVSGWRGQYTFDAGTTYYGLPYAQPVNSGKYVPWDASLSTFTSSVKDSSSLFYTSQASYGSSKTSTYYGADCSSFVSWAWGLSSRQTTSTLNSRGNVISGWGIKSLQVGDILNLSGSHTVLISSVEYDSSGAVSAVVIMEETPPITKTTRYGSGGTSLSTITSKYSSYSLVRHKDISSVPAPDGTVEEDTTFYDVPKSEWYYEAVEYVYANSLFTGTSSTTFSPSNNMTRGQLVTVIGRMAGVNTDNYYYTGSAVTTAGNLNFRSSADKSSTTNIISVLTKGTSVTVTGKSGDWYKVTYNGTTGYLSANYLKATSGFQDVALNSYYVDYIQWASQVGIISGYSSSKFGPDDNLTREQVCAIIGRYADYSNTSLSSSESAVTFSDASSISSYAKDYVTALQKAGVISGMTDGTFLPNGTATRAQVATILMKYHQQYA